MVIRLEKPLTPNPSPKGRGGLAPSPLGRGLGVRGEGMLIAHQNPNNE